MIVTQFGKIGAQQLVAAERRLIEQLCRPKEQRGSLYTLHLQRSKIDACVSPATLWGKFGSRVGVSWPRGKLKVEVPSFRAVDSATKSSRADYGVQELADRLDVPLYHLDLAEKALARFDQLSNADQACLIERMTPELANVVLKANLAFVHRERFEPGWRELFREKQAAAEELTGESLGQDFLDLFLESIAGTIVRWRPIFQSFYWEHMVEIDESLAELLPPGSIDLPSGSRPPKGEEISVGEPLVVDNEKRANRLFKFYTEVLNCKQAFTASGADRREYIVFPLRADNNARYAAVEDSELRYGHSMLLFRIDCDGELSSQWVEDAKLSRSELLKGKGSSFVCRMWHNETFEERLETRLRA